MTYLFQIGEWLLFLDSVLNFFSLHLQCSPITSTLRYGSDSLILSVFRKFVAPLIHKSTVERKMPKSSFCVGPEGRRDILEACLFDLDMVIAWTLSSYWKVKKVYYQTIRMANAKIAMCTFCSYSWFTKSWTLKNHSFLNRWSYFKT